MTADSAPVIPTIDPTLNVKEKIGSLETGLKERDEATHRYFEMLIKKDRELSTAMRDAETRRLNDLWKQRAEFDGSQADLLRQQVSGNAKLVSEQLDRVTTILSDRIAKLEQFRYESSGKGSGQSGAMAYVITFVSLAIAALSVALAVFKH